MTTWAIAELIRREPRWLVVRGVTGGVLLLLSLAACTAPRAASEESGQSSSNASTAASEESESPQPTRAVADDVGLVVARHASCDFGASVLRYLSTGDNQGNPAYDQNLAYAVGTTGPQARAIADKLITACDDKLDQQAAAQVSASAAADAARQSAQAQQQAQAEQQVEDARQAAALAAAERKSCAAVSGRADTDDQHCYSTVEGNPSGKAGADCIYPDGTPISISFDGDGALTSYEVSTTNDFYPGCFRL